MTTTSEKLKGLIRKMGGEPQGNYTHELIDEITELYEGGGSSGGSGVLAVTISAGDGESDVLDKSYNDIAEASASGQVVIIKTNNDNDPSMGISPSYLSAYGIMNNRYTVVFQSLDASSEYKFYASNGDDLLSN